MTATLTAPVEALLREQVAKGHFPSLDRALEVAVKTVFGRRASHALESLLDEALSRLDDRRASERRVRSLWHKEEITFGWQKNGWQKDEPFFCHPSFCQPV